MKLNYFVNYFRGVIAMKKENASKAKMYFTLAKKLLPENDEIKYNSELIETKK